MADFLKLRGVSEAIACVPAHELACWLEYIRRKANQPTPVAMLLQDVSYSVFQLRRAWASGMKQVDYADFRREVQFARVADGRPAPAQTAADHKRLFLGWTQTQEAPDADAGDGG